ncbi:DUF6002 family protein [Bacillus albus]|uniref:DUF6002 family protein n=1 Tax=Bacillus albus TaxID=2026189 RepID=UPI0030156024
MTNQILEKKHMEGIINDDQAEDLIVRYLDGVKKAFEKVGFTNNNNSFEPPFELPELDEKLKQFFSVAKAEYVELGKVREKNLYLLNLMKNPETQTTKTLASLLMVARAVNYIRKTGEGILIFTPSSGNKAIALRNAVERAIKYELVDPNLLRIATLTPKESVHKLRDFALVSNKSALRELNPVFVYKGDIPQDVKHVGKKFVDEYEEYLKEKYNLNIWYSLDIRNYKVADSVRAFFDYEHFPWNKISGKRIHCHSVSSAYGLLGYNFGRGIIENQGLEQKDLPGYLLIQHAKTSDMVLNLLYQDFSRDNFPKYTLDKDGIYKQDSNNHFPKATWDPEENLEPTFYTHCPPTSPEMNQLIVECGGTGIVVSLYECMSRYGEIKALLGEKGIKLPDDPRNVSEWSLIMAFTGVINAIERNLLNDFEDVIIHGSGLYCKGDYPTLSKENYISINNHQELFEAFNFKA